MSLYMTVEICPRIDCPWCGLTMLYGRDVDARHYLSCQTPQCPQFKVLYYAPTMILTKVPK
jgi:hypothetical protein